MTTEAPVRRSPLEAVFLGPYGLRAGWRILLWLTGATALTITGASAVRLATGALPGFQASFAISLAAAVLAGWFMLAVVDRRPLGALGFAADPAAARELGVGFAFGAGMILLAAALLAVAGSARWVADGGTVPEYVAALAGGLLLFAVAAAAEEAMFRGYAFQALVQGVGAWPAVLLTSALFALGHARNPNVDAMALANIFLAGVMLGWAYLRTRSLWFATAVHVGWNWAMSALLDFPVSGLVRDTPLYSAVETGADWWTGGEFGPEAGLAATVSVLLGTMWLLRTRRLRESERMRALRPLVDDRLTKE